MKVVTNFALANRRRRQAMLLSIAGLAVLGLGLYLSLTRPLMIAYAYAALVAGTLMSWLGVAMSEKWLRPPRADKALDKALKGAGRAFVLYNWSLSSDHVLMTPAGLVIVAVFNQEGAIAIRGDRWRESRPFWKRLFSLGRRPVRSPRRKLDLEVQALRDALAARDPELGLDDVPIDVVAVFTYPGVEVTVEDPDLPAMRVDALRDWLRMGGRGQSLSPGRRRKLELALDGLARSG